MDDEYEDDFQPAGIIAAKDPGAGRLNWADVAYASLWPARGFVEGCSNFFSVLMGVLELHSAAIDEQRAFRRDAGRAIESLSRGDD
jgi:hypothetical protein